MEVLDVSQDAVVVVLHYLDMHFRSRFGDEVHGELSPTDMAPERGVPGVHVGEQNVARL